MDDNTSVIKTRSLSIFAWVLSHDLIANLHNSLMSVFGSCKKKGGKCLDLKSDPKFYSYCIRQCVQAFLIKKYAFCPFCVGLFKS